MSAPPTPGLLDQVPGVDGQGREAKDGVSGAVYCKVDKVAEWVPRPSMVHAAHRGAKVAEPRGLNKVAHTGRRGGQVVPGNPQGRVIHSEFMRVTLSS